MQLGPKKLNLKSAAQGGPPSKEPPLKSDLTPQNTPPRNSAASQLAFKTVQPSDSRPDIVKTPAANVRGYQNQLPIELNDPSEKSFIGQNKMAGNINELSPIKIPQDASMQPYQDYSKDGFDKSTTLLKQNASSG
jgi:hypothetical protein